MIKGGLTLLFCISLSYLTFAQKVGVQFYQGVNKSLITFSGDNGTLDYSHWLGHTNIKTTQIYAKISHTKLQAQSERLNKIINI